MQATSPVFTFLLYELLPHQPLLLHPYSQQAEMSSPTTAMSAATPLINPFNQSFVLQDKYADEFSTTLDQLAEYVNVGIIRGIVFATQIGAATAVLIMLLILTKREKRRLPVFILNSFALLFTIIAGILQCLYYTGSWHTPYAYLSGDYSFVSPGAKGTSVASSLCLFLVQLFVEASLVMQVRVVYMTLESRRRLAVTIITVLMAALALSFRIAQTIENIKWNIIRESYLYDYNWLVQARDITLTVSICFFSAVFCVKLGWSMYQRHLLGLTQFGPMQIIFIGGTQTLVVPGKITTTTSAVNRY
jgi:pheromone alpha factor receptor